MKRFMFVAPTDPDELHAVNLHGVRSADEVVTTLLAVQAWSGAGAWGKQAKPPFPCPVISTSRYRKQPNPDVFRTLLAACARQKVVDVDYDARTREIITKFSPHTIVQTAQRVHFRGYSPSDGGGEGRYWDLVPSRVMRAEIRDVSGYVDGSGDTEWKEEIPLQLTLCQNVPPQMRIAICREHGMEGNILNIGPLPKALVQYVRAEYTHRRYEGYPFEVWAG